jgi:hypothetical protein
LTTGCGTLGLPIGALGQFVRSLQQLLARLLDEFDVRALERFLGGLDLRLDVGAFLSRHLVAGFAERLLHRVDRVVGLVPRFRLLSAGPLVSRGGLGVAHHAIDLVSRQCRAARDRHRLFLAGRHVLRGHVDYPVRVDVEGHLDLRHATRRRRQTDELEAPERTNTRRIRHLALALQDVNLDRRLVVRGRREDLGPASRDVCVPLDQLRVDVSERLHPHRERRDIEKEDLLHVALDDRCLDGCADRDGFVRIDALVRLFAGQAPHELLHHRHTRRAADEDHVAQISGRHARVADRLLERGLQLLDEVGCHLLEARTRQRRLEVERTFGGGRHEGEGDRRLLRLRELDLRLLRCFLQPLEGHAVLRQIDA